MLDHHDKRAILLMVLQVLENYSDEEASFAYGGGAEPPVVYPAGL